MITALMRLMADHKEAASALLIGVVWQVMIILLVGATIFWFENIPDVPLTETLCTGVTILLIATCSLVPFWMAFKGE
jgi:hypothetical protein